MKMRTHLLLALAVVAAVGFSAVAIAGYEHSTMNPEVTAATDVASLPSDCRLLADDLNRQTAIFINCDDVAGLESAITASDAELNIMDGVTATAAEINMAADISANAEITAATNPLTTAECGKTLTLSHATEFVTTLPAPTLGCKFSFIVANAPESADYTIVTADGLETISGVAFDMTGAAVSAGAGTAAADTISFVQAKAVISDRVDLFSDGIGWHGLGFSSASGAITYTSAQ